MCSRACEVATPHPRPQRPWLTGHCGVLPSRAILLVPLLVLGVGAEGCPRALGSGPQPPLCSFHSGGHKTLRLMGHGQGQRRRGPGGWSWLAGVKRG